MRLILFITPKSHLTHSVMDKSPAQADLKPARGLPDWSALNTDSFPLLDPKNQSSCGKGFSIPWDMPPPRGGGQSQQPKKGVT